MLDPSQSDMVDWEIYEVKEWNSGEDKTEWREVICSGDLTSFIVEKIQKALKNEGYYLGPFTPTIGVSTKSALTKYQKEHELPVGQLDVETLRALGVIW